MDDMEDFVIEGRSKNIKVFFPIEDVHLDSYQNLHGGGVVHVHPIREGVDLPDAVEVAEALNRLGPLGIDWDLIKLGDNAYLVNFLS